MNFLKDRLQPSLLGSSAWCTLVCVLANIGILGVTTSVVSGVVYQVLRISYNRYFRQQGPIPRASSTLADGSAERE
jgi:hypothetical protein